ncbi:MAG TPA: amino acid ABC transporter substrate-binding protein [bacterium]|nr:amino acid ABC transporter substrate-binding protein [bacterium]
MRNLLAAVAIAAVVIGLPATGSVGAPAGVAKIGSVIPLTGRYGGGGAQVRAGYELAVDDINRAGGVLVGGQHVQLQLSVLDDESDPTKTVTRIETLAGEGVVALLGGFASDMHAAAAPVAEKDKIPYCGVAFALHKIHEQGFRYLFSPFPKSPDLGPETYRMLNASISADQRPRRVAIFQERTDWGQEMGDVWTSRSREYGYQIVLRAQYSPLSRDMSDIILRAKSAGADAVFALPNPPDGITMIRQMKELDFNPKAIVLIRAADVAGWAQALGKDGDDVLLAPGWHHDVKFPGVAALNAEHEQRFHRPADVIVGPAYACVQIVANAIGRAGRLDAGAIRDAMAATNMQTVEGPVRFRPDGTGIVTTVFVQWQGGKQELVWPKDLGGARLIYPAPPWRAR